MNKIGIACDTATAAKAAFKSVQSGISKVRWGKGEEEKKKREILNLYFKRGVHEYFCAT